MAADLLTIAILKSAPHSERWLQKMREQRDPESLASFFKTGLKTREGDGFLVDPSARAVLVQNGLGWLVSDASNEEIARVLCVVRATNLRAGAEVLLGWYDGGGRAERRAILRGLSLVARPKAHVGLALRGVRDETDVFDALCYDNPYPATYLPDAAFSEMVQRALAHGGKIGRILGIVDREQEALARFKRVCDGSRPNWRSTPRRSMPTGTGHSSV